MGKRNREEDLFGTNIVLWQWIGVLILIVSGFIIYSNTFHAPFQFDDSTSIKQNSSIIIKGLTLSELIKVCTNRHNRLRCIGYVSFALNYYFGRLDVFGYHLVNIIIHILTGILFYFLALVTLKRDSLLRKGIDINRESPVSGIKSSQLAAFFAAFLWLVNPVMIQSVTYIVQRFNSMGSMFYVLSLYCYIRGRICSGKKGYLLYAASVLSGILALGCKQNMWILPFFIVLYEFYFFQDLNPRKIKRFFSVTVIPVVCIIVLLALFWGNEVIKTLSSLFSTYESRGFSMTERVITQFRVVLYYISLIFYPHPERITLDPDFPISRSLFMPWTTLPSILAVFAILGLGVYLAKRERLISFGIFWFFGNLVIESTILPLQMVFQHRVYLPSMFVFLILTATAFHRVRHRRGLIIFFAITGLVFSYWTYRANEVWKDSITLWADIARKSPRKARAWGDLGLAYYQAGMLDKALLEYKKALSIDPKYKKAYYNLADIYRQKGMLDEAISEYKKALAIDPGYKDAHNNLGVVYRQKGMLDEAILEYKKALAIDPDFKAAHYNM
jgi:hypothetical protein